MLHLQRIFKLHLDNFRCQQTLRLIWKCDICKWMAYNISIVIMCIVCKEIALQIWTMEFLTSDFNLIVILTVINTELKTIRKKVNESKEGRGQTMKIFMKKSYWSEKYYRLNITS